jgi:hypothetical protein
MDEKVTHLEYLQVILVLFDRDQILKIVIVQVGDHQTMKPQVLLDYPIQEVSETRLMVIDMELHRGLMQGRQYGGAVKDVIPLQKMWLNEDVTLVQGPHRFCSLFYYFHS